jgi:hypothetical protein
MSSAREHPRAKGSPRFVILLLFSVARLMAGQTTGNTVISATDCPICTDAQWNQWQAAYLHSSGALGRDVLGQRIGLNHAKSHDADPDDGPKWHNLDVMKRTVCGPLRSFRVSVFDTEEFDWGLSVAPNAHYSSMIDEAKAATAILLHDFSFIDVDQFVDALVDKKWEGKIKGEITPDEDFRQNDFFQGFPPFIPEHSPLAEEHRQVCLYGPFVLDVHHSWHPEIHPSELIWWQDPSHIWLLVLQDDSDRFDFDNELVAFATRPEQVLWMKEDPENWTRPWSAWPRWAEFRVAFKADPAGNSVSRYKIRGLEAQHVITSQVDSARFDTDNGSVHALESAGKVLVEVTEAQTDSHVGVRFAEVCRTKVGQGLGQALIGFVNLNTVVGDGGAELGGFQLLRIDVLQEADVDIFLTPIVSVPPVNLSAYQTIIDSISVLRNLLGSFRTRFEASSVRRIGGRLVADVWAGPDSGLAGPQVRSASWHGKSHSRVLKHSRTKPGPRVAPARVQAVPVLDSGYVSFQLDSGPPLRMPIPEIVQVPLARSARRKDARASRAAASALTAVLGEPVAKLAPGEARSAASWVISVEPRYAPVVDSAPHPEDEGPIAETLNEAIRRRRKGATARLTELFGKAQPFSVTWAVTATNMTTGKSQPLRVGRQLRKGLRAMPEQSLHGQNDLRILFPEGGDTVYRIDAVATVLDPYGLRGSVRHRLWSHYLSMGPSDSAAGGVTRLVAAMAGISVDSLLRVPSTDPDETALTSDTTRSWERRIRLAAAQRAGVRRALRDSSITVGELQGLSYSAKLYDEARNPRSK